MKKVAPLHQPLWGGGLMKIRWNMKELSKKQYHQERKTAGSNYNKTKKTESKHGILIGKNDEDK
jgi:hypothetical protein